MLAYALSDASRSSTSTSIAALSASLLLLAATTVPPLRQLLTVHSMDDMQADYNNYWETKCFLNVDDLDSTYYDSSLPDNGAGSSSGLTNEKGNIIMERNMRRKLNESLYTLRSVVPNITKINKASIIKDAIVHIQELQEEEKRLMAEVSVIQSRKVAAPSISKVEQSGSTVTTGGKKRRIRRAPRSPSSPSLQVVEVPMEGRV